MTDHPTEIEYLLVEDSALKEFKLKVERAALHGFKIQGGVSITNREGNYVWYAQAMVRARDSQAVPA